MSLSKDKASLFATGPQKTGAAKPAAKAAVQRAPPAAAPAPAPAVVKTRGGAVLALSAEAKARKIAEAKENSDKGTKSLQTSIFQWSPDYVLAAPFFERAGECYKIAGEFNLARLMFIQAADAHEKQGANSACALTLLKAAAIAQIEDNASSAAELFKQSAQQWMFNGDARKAADAFDKAAAELENVSEDAAAESYHRACDLIFPEETPASQISNVSANAVEIFRNAIRFSLKQGRFNELLKLLERLQKLYQAFDLQSGMCKVMMAVTLVQLHTGDIVEADKTFLQTHLNNSIYLNSNECAVAELFLNAFKNFDIEALDKARGPMNVMYADSDFQAFARSLTFMGSNHIGMTTDTVSDERPLSSKSIPSDVANLQADVRNVNLEGDDVDELPPSGGPTDFETTAALGAVDVNGNDNDDDDINLC